MTIDLFLACELSETLVLWSTTSIDDAEPDWANALADNSEKKIPKMIFDLFMRMEFINYIIPFAQTKNYSQKISIYAANPLTC